MAVVNTKDTCNSCLFFVFGERMGECKRYPISANKANDDWCGEFSALINIPIQSMVNAIIEPLIAEKQQKQRGRPKKS
jgi:hypothetical protein